MCQRCASSEVSLEFYDFLMSFTFTGNSSCSHLELVDAQIVVQGYFNKIFVKVWSRQQV